MGIRCVQRHEGLWKDPVQKLPVLFCILAAFTPTCPGPKGRRDVWTTAVDTPRIEGDVAMKMKTRRSLCHPGWAREGV